jgi:23S rRNA pseudouridine1911/1915/1917 synthase
MAHLKHPVVGDPVYGGRLRLPKGCAEPLAKLLRAFRRQALHAVKLTLVHPATGKTMSWAASVPEDMGKLMEALTDDARR